LFHVKRLEIPSVVLAVMPPRLAELLLVVFLAVVLNSGRSLAANAIVEGDEWLKWNDETRLAYVSAYIWGLERGFRDGCEAGQRVYAAGKPKGLPAAKCLPEAPAYSKYSESYAAMITEFYRTHPDDKRVPIRLLLEGMSDQRNLTQEQMHEYYGSNAKKP
jgi:hypothetical protein